VSKNQIETIPFEGKFNRSKFSCGKHPLDNYILRNATKDVKAGACTCFVIINDDQEDIAYYTLSTDTIPLEDAPAE
jgi:hypothetical protein